MIARGGRRRSTSPASPSRLPLGRRSAAGSSSTPSTGRCRLRRRRSSWRRCRSTTTRRRRTSPLRSCDDWKLPRQRHQWTEAAAAAAGAGRLDAQGSPRARRRRHRPASRVRTRLGLIVDDVEVVLTDRLTALTGSVVDDQRRGVPRAQVMVVATTARSGRGPRGSCARSPLMRTGVLVTGLPFGELLRGRARAPAVGDP